MKNSLITKEDFLNVINRSIKRGEEVVAPVKQENQSNFKRIKSANEILWGGPQTVIPPKSLVLPQEEELIKYAVGDKIEVQVNVGARPVILLGVHPCQIGIAEHHLCA